MDTGQVQDEAFCMGAAGAAGRGGFFCQAGVNHAVFLPLLGLGSISSLCSCFPATVGALRQEKLAAGGRKEKGGCS